jgi:hypothetical protein
LGIKGINFNLNQFLFGKDTMVLGGKSSVEEVKPKLYNAMEGDPESEPERVTEPKPDKGSSPPEGRSPHEDSEAEDSEAEDSEGEDSEAEDSEGEADESEDSALGNDEDYVGQLVFGEDRNDYR